jgi:hypothetical protein
VQFTANGRSDNQVRLADPVWINATGLGEGDKVAVKVEFWEKSNILYGSGEPRLIRTFEHFDRKKALTSAEEGRFTGELGPFAVRHTIGSARTDWNVGQKIRISVNGTYLRDPISGTDQFLIFLDDGKCCAF